MRRHLRLREFKKFTALLALNCSPFVGSFPSLETRQKVCVRWLVRETTAVCILGAENLLPIGNRRIL